MGHCYGNDLRRRAVEAITGGLSARGAAARFRVAPATAIHWRRRETGSIEPDRQGHRLLRCAVRVKIRDEGLVKNKAVYLAIGYTCDGYKQILGMWVEQTEGAKFWLSV